MLAGVPEGLDASTWAWLAVSGAANVAGLVVAGFAFRVGKVGIVAPILATEGAISAVLAALRGESIAPSVAFTLLVIVGGVIVATIAPDPEPVPDERPLRAAGLAVVGALCFGIGLTASGHLIQILPIAWLLLPARVIGVLVLAIPLLVLGRLVITRRSAPLVIGMGIAEVLGFTSFAIGAQYLVGVTSVLASQFAPIAAIMAFFLFKERLGRLQIAGVAVIVAGVVGLTALTAG